MSQQLKQAFRRGYLKAAGVGALVATSGAHATGTDYSSIIDAVDWSSVETGIITVLASVAAVIVVFVGGKFLIQAIRAK